jgi:hypothetical protein
MGNNGSPFLQGCVIAVVFSISFMVVGATVAYLLWKYW